MRDKFKYEGKLVATLSYKEHDADVSIPVRLVQEKRRVKQSKAPWKGTGSKPKHTAGCKFRVYYEEIGLKVKGDGKPSYAEATDIEVLRAIIMEKLDKKHEIKWERWLLVTVAPGYREGLDEVSIEFTWEGVRIAHLPGGRTVHRCDGYRRGDEIQDGMPETGTSRRREMRALIPATEENEAALENFRDRVEALRKKMMDFMSPEKIEKSMGMLGRLLPPPPPKEEKKGKKGR